MLIQSGVHSLSSPGSQTSPLTINPSPHIGSHSVSHLKPVSSLHLV